LKPKPTVNLIQVMVITFLLFTNILIGQSSVENKEKPVELKQGKPIEREMTSGEIHVYEVNLKSNQFLYAVAEQRGIDVVIKIIDPRGEQISELNNSGNTQGWEPIYLETSLSGKYKFEISSADKYAEKGNYEIRIEVLQKAAVSEIGKVDQLFEFWNNTNTGGAAISVIKDGKVIHKRGYGSAQVENNIPITTFSMFNVASISKQFTAFAAALLASENKLSLDDDIHKYIPELNDFGKKVTLKHMIYHTSGIREYYSLLYLAGWRNNDFFSKEDFMKMMINQKELNFEPGSEQQYCNSGYSLLAEIVARVSKKSYREFTDSAIFKPLGMSNTHFIDDNSMLFKNRTTGYTLGKDGLHRVPSNNEIVGSGNMHTSVEDLAKWALNFYNPKIGGQEVHEQILQQGKLNNGEILDYAFGLAIGSYKGLKTVSHGGGVTGYRSVIVNYPNQKFSVIILSNLNYFNPGVIARKVADIYLAKYLITESKTLKSENQTEVKIDPRILEKYTGMYQIRLGQIITISIEDEKLMVHLTEGRKSAARAESETKFFVPSLNESITFENNVNGKAQQLVYLSKKAIRVFPFSPSEEHLKEFEGNYYSDEIGAVYSIISRDGKLFLQHRKKSDNILTPIVTDQFSSPGSQYLGFKRDGQNKIIGFMFSDWGTRNLKFEKMSK
jgi:CubicO group peptidase (beta-lactamase class C family)